MVVGPPFKGPKQERFGQNREHKQLTPEQREHLFSFFKNYYKP